MEEFIDMKATGIVRKIDELGRVVIPKEIRRTLKISEGDPLEIFTSRDGEVIFKKYSPLNELGGIAKSCAKALYDSVGHIVVVCDKDSIVACNGAVRDGYTGKHISERLEELLLAGKPVSFDSGEADDMVPLRADDSEDDYVAQIVTPITGGDTIIGGVILASQKPGTKFTSKEMEMCSISSSILSNYVGE